MSYGHIQASPTSLSVQGDSRYYFTAGVDGATVADGKFNLNGQKLSFDIDVSQVPQCCNAAFYMVAMSDPNGKYCDIQMGQDNGCLEYDLCTCLHPPRRAECKTAAVLVAHTQLRLSPL